MRNALTDTEIVELQEWLDDELIQPIRVMHQGGKTLWYERPGNNYRLSDPAGEVSTHVDLRSGVRALEAHRARTKPTIKL